MTAPSRPTEYDGPTPLGLLAEALIDHDEHRPRSLQVATGASQVDGCRAEAIFRLRGTPVSDPRLSWPATVGNAVHEWAATAVRAWADRTGARVVVEERLTYRGLPVTVDAVFVDHGIAVDWKTLGDAAALAQVRRHGPSIGQQMQAHLAVGAAREADLDVTIAALLFVPREGDLSDAVTWQAPYDEALADRGVAQALERDQLAADPDVRPEDHRDQPWHWCRDWCEFVSACRGEQTAPSEVDAEALLAATEWLQARQDEADAEAPRKAAAQVLDHYADAGLDLRAAGVRRQGGNVGVEERVDDTAVRRAYEQMLGPLPTMTTEKVTSVSWRKAGR